MKRKASVKDRIKGVRLAHLILSLGWEGAAKYLQGLTPEEKKDYFTDQKDPKS